MTCNNARITRNDETWLDISRRAGVLEKDECAVGRTAEQVKQAQRVGLKEGYTSLAESAAAEVAGTVAAASNGVLAGVIAATLGPGHTCMALWTGLERGHREGEQQNEAYRRDAVNLAFVWVGSQALPSDYVAFKSEELKAAGGWSGPAQKILSQIQGDADKWQRLVKETNEGVYRIRQAGAQIGIHSKTSLKAALAKEPGLERAYNTNLIIRHAFDSLVLEGERGGPRTG